MTSHSAAARVWAAIERRLLRLQLVRDGRDLREARADMVRTTGEALGVPKLADGLTSTHDRPLRLDDSGPSATRVPATSKTRTEIHPYAERRPAIQHTRIARGTKVADVAPPDGAVTRRLDRYLDASCKAGGYSGDDEVEYGKR